jgi:hypothetical protein
MPLELDIETLDYNERDWSFSSRPLLKALEQRRQLIAPYLSNLKTIQLPTQGFQTDHDIFTQQVDRVKKDIARYFDDDSSLRPFNILISAPPGAGKTRLVKHLIDSKPYLHCDLSGYNWTETLGQFLCDSKDQYPERPDNDAQQADHTTEPPVLFFDEVDSPQYNYFQRFLLPMSDGLYHNHFILHQFYRDVKKAAPGDTSRAILFFAMSTTLGKVGPPMTNFSYNHWLDSVRLRAKNWLDDTFTPGKTRDFLSRVHYWLKIPPLRSHFCNCPITRRVIANTTKCRHTCLNQIYWQETELLKIIANWCKGKTSSDLPCKIDRRVLQYLTGAFPDSRRDIETVIVLSTPDKANRQFLWEHLPHHILTDGAKTDWHQYCENQHYDQLLIQVN